MQSSSATILVDRYLMRLQHCVELVRDMCQASVWGHCPCISCHDVSSEDDGTDQGYDGAHTHRFLMQFYLFVCYSAFRCRDRTFQHSAAPSPAQTLSSWRIYGKHPHLNAQGRFVNLHTAIHARPVLNTWHWMPPPCCCHTCPAMKQYLHRIPVPQQIAYKCSNL